MERKPVPELAANIIILRKLCQRRYLEAAHFAHDLYRDEYGDSYAVVRQALIDQLVEMGMERGEYAQEQDIVDL